MLRRDLLVRLGGGLGAAAVLAACGSGSRESGSPGTMDPVERIDYGPDPSQFAELTRPAGRSRGVVVVIHGGFWRAAYDLSLGRPIAAALAEQGWTAWNLEYRRVGGGGGWPVTGQDVGRGIDALADVPDLDLGRVVTLGHSAGGHLAVWAAGRADARVPVTHAISQAGVLDLRAGSDLGGGAVSDLLGADPDDVPEADPVRQVPLPVPVRCVHGRDDANVPLEQSERYVRAATAAGADATLTVVDGDHFTLIDPASRAWRRTLELLPGA